MNSSIIEHLRSAGRLDRMFVGGEWVMPETQARSYVVHPSTEEPVGEIALGSARDVAAAVAASRRGFDPGRCTSTIRPGTPRPRLADTSDRGTAASTEEGLEEYLETKAILGFQDGPASSTA